jgi:serine/threonine protein kinase
MLSYQPVIKQISCLPLACCQHPANPTDPPVLWFDYPPGWEWLSACGSGGIYYSPDNPTEVLKLPSNADRSIKAIEIEKRIYQRLGSHPNIVPVIRIDDTGILLRRAEHGSLREFFRKGGTATMDERILWCQDIAAALQYVHEHGIKQVDIGAYPS